MIFFNVQSVVSTKSPKHSKRNDLMKKRERERVREGERDREIDRERERELVREWESESEIYI